MFKTDCKQGGKSRDLQLYLAIGCTEEELPLSREAPHSDSTCRLLFPLHRLCVRRQRLDLWLPASSRAADGREGLLGPMTWRGSAGSSLWRRRLGWGREERKPLHLVYRIKPLGFSMRVGERIHRYGSSRGASPYFSARMQ
jgi:hypothetical protein